MNITEKLSGIFGMGYKTGHLHTQKNNKLNITSRTGHKTEHNYTLVNQAINIYKKTREQQNNLSI